MRGIDVDAVFPRNAGFDLHLGTLGSIEEIRIPHEVLQTGQFDAKLAIALFLDEDEDGDFFLWNDGAEGPDRWQALGDDEEAIEGFPAGEELVIDADTTFRLLNTGANALATIGGLKNGTIDYYTTEDSDRRQNRNIDASTNVALYVGLADTGEGDAVEAIINDVSVTRT